jgi:predicted SAM-dependent methyltransferase
VRAGGNLVVLKNRLGKLATRLARSSLGRRWFARRLSRLVGSREVAKLHLGCGPRLLPGWVNIDFILGCDVLLDLRLPIPLRDGTVDYVYSEDFLEHLTFQEGTGLLGECARILKPGGVLRLATPDLKALAQAYLERSERSFRWYRENFPGIFTFAQMFNSGMRAWGHRFLYDEEALTVVLERLGLEVTREKFDQSAHAALRGLEFRNADEGAQSMYLEATKPAVPSGHPEPSTADHRSSKRRTIASTG